MFQRNFKLNIALLFLIPLFSFAQEIVLTNLNNFYPDRVESAGFSLSMQQEIIIEASAIKPYSSDRYKPLTEAWILNSKTRDVMWVLGDAESTDRERNITTYKDNITLDAGNYEVYYSTFLNRGDGAWWNNGRNHPGFFEQVFGEVFYDNNWGFSGRDYDDLFINITGNGQAIDDEAVAQWQQDLKSASIIEFTNQRDERFSEQLIEVSKATDVKVYAIGEASEDGEYDFAWIVDLNNRKKVWDLTYRRSGHAGGAQKNRFAEEIIRLEPGKYKVVSVTDDSHSYRKWNSAPPYDPAFWGVTLWVVNDQDKTAIALLEGKETDEKNIIVKFERVRDQEYLSEGFSLKKPLKVHIYALGEGSDGNMYDYGWIVNVKTREKVWEMKYRETDNAGGAQKNRVYDGSITLEAGNYVAHYVTDGSHSFRRWNAGRPYDEDGWGMRISALDDKFSKDDIAVYDEANDTSILVRITRVGDHDKARARFELEKEQDVHIYAIGEGSGNRMYDYAWIENTNTGRIVWKMTYRKTERAGGARKNRLADETIRLDAGEYEVFYETDDSHSFADWNDTPPHDPVHWGITITRIDK